MMVFKIVTHHGKRRLGPLRTVYQRQSVPWCRSVNAIITSLPVARADWHTSFWTDMSEEFSEIFVSSPIKINKCFLQFVY